MSEALEGALLEIAEADSPRALRLAAESAKQLSEDEKEIARWSYAYAAEEMRMKLRTPGEGGSKNVHDIASAIR